MLPIATLNYEGQKLVDKYLGFLVAQRDNTEACSPLSVRRSPVRLRSCPSIQPPISVPVLGFPPLLVLLSCSQFFVIFSQFFCLRVCCRENLN